MMPGRPVASDYVSALYSPTSEFEDRFVSNRLVHNDNNGAKEMELGSLSKASSEITWDVLGADTSISGETRNRPHIKEAREPSTDTGGQMTVSREELDAKLEASEARMDTRVAEVVGRIDALIASQQGLDKLYQSKFDAIQKSQDSTQAGISNLKSTFIVTAIGSVIAIVLGIAAFNATVLSNMVASFESGKSTAMQIGENTKKLEQLQERLEQTIKQQGASEKSKSDNK